MATFDPVRLPDDSTNTGKYEDHTVVATDKHREVIVIGDPDTQANVTKVTDSTPGASDFGAVVRDVNTPAIKTSVAAIAVSDASIDGKTPALGQAAMAASVPMVIASDQSAVPVSGTVAVTGVATAANQATQITQETATATSTASIDTKIGEVSASPTANTVLARLKDLLTGIVLAAGSATIGSIASITTSLTPGTAAANLGKAEDNAHSSGDVGVMSLAVANEANTTFAADGDYVPLGTNREGSPMVVGNRAHDAVDAGNPVKVGAKAIAFGTNPTAVAANDRTDTYANRAGIPWVLGGHPNIITIEAAYTAAQTDTAIVTISTGLKIVVTAIDVTCDNANTVDVGVRVGFGTANTPTTTGVVLTHPGIAPGSGVILGSGAGILGVGADNEDLRITSEVPTTGSVRVRVSYFTIES